MNARSNEERGAAAGRALVVYGVLVVLLVAIGVLSLVVGKGSVRDGAVGQAILLVRASRFAGAALVGAALAVAGLLVQGVFRNPLADASILGVSAGATLGGNVALVGVELLTATRSVRGVPPDAVVPLGSLAGAILALGVLLALLRRSHDILSMIVVGFILASLSLSLSSLVTSIAQDRWELGRAVVSFALGGLSATGTTQLAISAPLIAAGLVASYFWAGSLDLLLAGDDEAASLGVDVGRVRRYSILWISALVAGAVSLGGGIGFVGLLVPHALRRLFGVAHRRLVPLGSLAGALFVAGSDLLARVLPARSEVPLGVVTGLIGAPVFLFILFRAERSRA